MLLRKWGNKGKGRNEYIQLGSGFSIHDSTLVFLDEVRQEINYVPIKGVLEDVDLSIDKEAYPYTRDFRPFHIDVVGKYRIAVGGFADGRFGVLDSLGRIVSLCTDFPFEIPDEIIYLS